MSKLITFRLTLIFSTSATVVKFFKSYEKAYEYCGDYFDKNYGIHRGRNGNKYFELIEVLGKNTYGRELFFERGFTKVIHPNKVSIFIDEIFFGSHAVYQPGKNINSEHSFHFTGGQHDFQFVAPSYITGCDLTLQEMTKNDLDVENNVIDLIELIDEPISRIPAIDLYTMNFKMTLGNLQIQPV